MGHCLPTDHPPIVPVLALPGDILLVVPDLPPLADNLALLRDILPVVPGLLILADDPEPRKLGTQCLDELLVPAHEDRLLPFGPVDGARPDP